MRRPNVSKKQLETLIRHATDHACYADGGNASYHRGIARSIRAAVRFIEAAQRRNKTSKAKAIAMDSGDLSNTVQRLVDEGHVCATIGHRWEDGCGMLGCLVMHGWPIRHCVICRKTETRAIGEWK